MTLVELLGRRLGQLGVLRVYGSRLGGLDHVAVEDPDLAVLLADMDGRLGHVDGSGRLGAALLDGPILHLSSKPGGTSVLEHVSTARDLFDLLADPPGMETPGTLALHLDLDLEQTVGEEVADRAGLRSPVLTLDPSMAGLRIVLLVGVGVVRSSAVDDLRELARRVGWGVATTWGARGVERWDSPFDFGTVGLQERDLELSGVLDADVVITSGLDSDELDMKRLGSKLLQDVPPRQLGALVEGWPVSRQPPDRSRHHDVLAEALVPMYESEDVPLSAPRAVLHLAGALPDGGVVIGEPGAAGFWLARAFPTSAPETLCVPATSVPGSAAAGALVCAIEGRRHVAVVDRIDDHAAAVIDLAERLHLALDIQSWAPTGGESLTSASDHVELTLRRKDLTGTSGAPAPSGALGPTGVPMPPAMSEPSVVEVPVATDRFDEVVRVMGEPVAWGGSAAWVGLPW